MDSTPSLHVLGDVESVGVIGEEVPLMCNRSEFPCSGLQLVLDKLETMDDCSDWVFGVRWSPENFLKKAVLVGHPFKEFSGLLPEVKLACEKLANWSYEDVVNWRCKKLGEWLRLAKSLQ